MDICKVNEYTLLLMGDSIVLKERRDNMGWTVFDDEDLASELVINMNNLYHMDSLLTEESYCIAYDIDDIPLGIIQLSHGNAMGTASNIYLIPTFLMLTRSTRCAVIHNHPGEDNSLAGKYSSADCYVYLQLKPIINNMGGVLLDDIIVWDGGYKSAEEMAPDRDAAIAYALGISLKEMDNSNDIITDNEEKGED